MTSLQSPPRAIAPYRAEDSGQSLEARLAVINSALYQNYSSDYRTGIGVGKVVANPLFEYERLLRELGALPEVAFVTMEDLIAGRYPREKLVISIRHDVDGDIVAAVEMAGLEQAHGISTTYYILHTSFYYGQFERGRFLRHECMASLYHRLQERGHEVSLHTDPLHIYQEHRQDGAAAVVEEIRWLRSLGLRVPGSAAHNHTSVYGAQNFEMFKGRLRHYSAPSGVAPPPIDAAEVVHHGKWAPLHVLDEAELGLSYEGHDAYNVPGYLGIMADIDFNTINQTWNVRADPKGRGLKQGPGHRDQLFEAMRKARPGEVVIFTIHPLYYGARHNQTDSPPVTLDHVAPGGVRRHGGRRYRPGSVVAVSERYGAEQIGQTINFANEWGFLSRPAPPLHARGRRILILGDEVIEGMRVGMPDFVECQLEKLLSARGGKGATVTGSDGDDIFHVRTAAFAGLGPADYLTLWRELRRCFPATIVVLSVNPDSAALGGQGSAKDENPVNGGQRFMRAARALIQSWRGATSRPGGCSGTSCRELIDAIRREGATPMLLAIRPGTHDLGGADDDMARVASEMVVPLIDPSAALRAYAGPGRAIDGCGAWTYIGHRIVAAELAATLLSHLKPS